MSGVELVNLIAGLASLILAVVAIWFTLHFKAESDRVNAETRNLLMEVKTDAKALASVAETLVTELREYGKTSREVTRQLAGGHIPQMTIANLSTGSSEQPPAVPATAPTPPEGDNPNI